VLERRFETGHTKDYTPICEVVGQPFVWLATASAALAIAS
jgi:hypothetical protein